MHGAQRNMYWISVEDSDMAKVIPFHSTRPGTQVHHNNDKCTEGNNIEWFFRVQGTGGLPLCEHCKRLS